MSPKGCRCCIVKGPLTNTFRQRFGSAAALAAETRAPGIGQCLEDQPVRIVGLSAGEDPIDDVCHLSHACGEDDPLEFLSP
jgi:hypothetical protein